MKRLFFFVALGVGAGGALPLFSDAGFLTTRAGGDSPFNLFRLHQLYTALQDGVFPVRWMPDAVFGLGYPFFNFYAALPYYFAAAFKAMGFSYVLSLKLVVLFGFMVASGGMYGWMKAITKHEHTALLAAAAYTFAPYHLVNIYVRGDSLSEFWAMAWYPVILWAMHAAAQNPTRRHIAGVALAYGALVVTHNISALIFSPFVVLYGCLLVFQSGTRLKTLLVVGGSGVLGLALAAWFWIPAITEQDTVQLEDQTTGYFFYGNHFLEENLIQGEFAHDYNAVGTAANPFSMGLTQAVLIGGGLLALLIHLLKKRQWWQDGFLLVGLLLTTFMMTPSSQRVWELLPLLPLVQFPWRFLAIQALFGGAVIGFLVNFSSLYGVSRAGLFISGILGVILAAAALGRLKTDFMPITDQDVTVERLYWYESFTGNLGTTIRAEYLPVSATPRPTTSDYLLQRPPHAKFLSGTGAGQQTRHSASRQTWDIDVTSDHAQITLPLLYWPGWKVMDSGEEISVSAVEGLGTIQVDLPQGRHTLELKFTRTPRRLLAELVSLAALITVAVVSAPKRPIAVNFSGQEIEKVAVVLAVFFLVFVALRVTTEDSDTPHIISADFAQSSYFHSNDIPYENGMSLKSVDYRLDGAAFFYNFVWGNPQVVTGRLDIASPLPVYFLGGPIFPVTIEALESGELGGSKTLRNMTPGVYFPRLLLFEPERATTQDTPRISPLTHHGVGRGDIYLAPVIVRPNARVVENSEQSVTLGTLKLLAATTRGDSEYLHIVLWWETLAEVPMNYGVDVQMLDVNGTQWARFNALVGGAGMYPTSLWRAGEIIPDNYRLPLPYGIPPGEYQLRLNLYHPVTLESLYQADIPAVQQTYVSEYTCPLPQNSPYHDNLRVNELIVPASVKVGGKLAVDMVWSAATPPQDNYQLVWTLRNEAGTAWENQTTLAPGSEATAWRTDSECGAYIWAYHRMDIPESLVPGVYTLTMQLLSENGSPLVDIFEAALVEVTP